jgi:DNA polymerase-3 subunit beta
MKINCSQKELKDAIKMVLAAVPTRPTHPILGCILLRVTGDQLQLTGFDLALGIQININCESRLDGAIAIPAKTFSDIISMLPDEDITILVLEDNTITITSSSGKYNIQGQDSEDYPLIPNIEDGKQGKLNLSSLCSGIKATFFSASADETKQVLTGINIKYEEGKFTFASTDGHRLTVWEKEEEGDDPVEQIALQETIRSTHIKEVERIFRTTEDTTISVAFDDVNIQFSNDKYVITGRKLDGAFPAYKTLIPPSFQSDVCFDRKAMISAIERVAVLCDQKNNIVRAKINSDDQNILLMTSTREVGTGNERISAQVGKDGDIEIGFCTKYLLEALKSFDTTEVVMKYNSNNHPVIFYPLGGDKITHLIMPIQIRE